MYLNYRVLVKYRSKYDLFVFCLIVLFYITTSILFDHFVYTDDLYFNSLSNKIEWDRINSAIGQNRRWAWLRYISTPLVIFIKIALPSTCLYIYFLVNDFKLKWNKVFKIAIEAEVIFIIPLILKLGWFLFYPPNSLQSIPSFSPWSLSFLSSTESPSYIKYILQTINIFEILYWIALASGIRSALKISFGQSMAIVAKSYGLGLLLWVTLVCFLLIQFS